MSRKILYIAYLYPPVGGRGLPGAQRIVKFVNHLGCSVAHVLTVNTKSYPAYTSLDNPIAVPVNDEHVHRTGILDVFDLLLKFKDIFANTKKRDASTGVNNSVTRNSTTSSGLWNENNNRSIWAKSKDFISDVFRFPDSSSSWIIPAVYRGQKLVKENGITVIIATGAPWSSLYIAYLIGKLRKVPYIVDFRDPWIDNPFHVSKGKLLDKLAVRMEHAIVNNACLVTANTRELRESFLHRYAEMETTKFITVTNGFSADDYANVVRTNNCKYWDSSKKTLVLAHAGFLYGTRDPAPIIESIEKIKKTINDECEVIFAQIGGISLEYDFHERYADLIKSRKIILLDQMPFQECLQVMCEADVLLNIQPKTTTQIPSKIYDYLCLDLPILNITPMNGALGNMVNEYGFGDVHESDDIDGICHSILKNWRNKQLNGTLITSYANKGDFDIQKISNNFSSSISALNL